MENKDMPAFPTTTWEQLPNLMIAQVTEHSGLTKREKIAAMIDVSRDGEGKSIGFIEALMGEKIPNDHIENYKYWARVEAKMRVIKADALLTELSKPQTTEEYPRIDTTTRNF